MDFYISSSAIETEAIFRITPKLKNLNVIKERLDAGHTISLFYLLLQVYNLILIIFLYLGDDVNYAECQDPHLVATLLKTYLRELPDPLMTFALYPRFVEAASSFIFLNQTKQNSSH